MGRITALSLAGLFAAAVTIPGIAAAACAGHNVTAETKTVTTVDGTGKTPVTPIPETKTGG
jgi:hypothetical protein